MRGSAQAVFFGVLLAAMLVSPLHVMQGQDRALAGLRVIRIYVPAVANPTVVSTPDSSRLRDILELALRRAGLEIRSFQSDSVSAYLNYEVVCVSVPGLDTQLLSCSLTLSMNDIVDLRNGRGLAYADVWSRSFVLVAGRNLVHAKFDEVTQTLATDFVSEWHVANPR